MNCMGLGNLLPDNIMLTCVCKFVLQLNASFIIHGAELNIFYIFLLKLFYMFWLFENIIVIICLELKSKLKT